MQPKLLFIIFAYGIDGGIIFGVNDRLLLRVALYSEVAKKRRFTKLVMLKSFEWSGKKVGE